MHLDKGKGLISPGQLLMEYMVVLFTNIAVVHSFLAELDPAFIVCHDYAHAGEEGQASRLAQFVAPNDAIRDMYEASLLATWKPHTTPKSEQLDEDFNAMGSRLQRKLDAFEAIYCG